MGDPSDSKRVHRLANLGDAEALLEVLERGDGATACQAALALAELGERRAEGPIIERMRAADLDSGTEDEILKWTTLTRALAQLAEPGSPGADELLAVLERDPGRVAWSAIEALGDIRDARAIEPLVRRLTAVDLNSPPSDTDQMEWETVATALGELQASEAVDPLVAGLKVNQFLEISAYALGDIGDPRAVAALAALLEAELSAWNANAVFVALEEIGTTEARKAIAASEARGGSPPYPPRLS